MSNQPKILDNSSNPFKVKSFLSEQLSSGNFTQFSVATGYWDLPAVLELKDSLEIFLNNNLFSEIRFLIGEEPTIRSSQLDTSFPEKYLKSDLSGLPFKPEFKEVVEFLTKYIDTGRIIVKLYKKSFLHAKCYILGSEAEHSVGIIGSSNFTKNGLLGNTELNDVEYDHRIVNYLPQNENQDPSHRSWFEKLWNDEQSIEWTKQFKIEILGLSKFGSLSYSPYELYIKILYEIYGDDIEIEENLRAETFLQSRVDLTLFQEESVKKVIARLRNPKIGMCLVADSVGLGKSFIAKKILEEFGYFGRLNVVIICPASLREDWENHLKDITLNAPIYSITEFALDESFESVKHDLMQRKIKSKNRNAVELLVIDESHNLKTQASKSFRHLLEILTDHEYCENYPKILMLSATPVNNGIKDLANQILLAKGGNDKFFAGLGIESITSFFRSTQSEFRRIGSEEVFSELYPILNRIMVKRTRHQVKKDFPDATLNGEKIIFPEENLENVLYELDSRKIRKIISNELDLLSKSDSKLFEFFTIEMSDYEEEEEDKLGLEEFFKLKKEIVRKNQTEYESIFHFIDRAIKGLKLVPYSYLTEKLIKTSDEESQANSRKNLTGVMKVTLFKSFDSSIFTFSKRIERYSKYLEQFEKLFFDENILVKPAIISKALRRFEDEPDEDVIDLIYEEIEKFNARQNNNDTPEKAFVKISLDDYNTSNIKSFISQDKEIIKLLNRVIDSIDKDTKLLKLKSLLNDLKGQKVLIFSYFATTVDYLKQELTEKFLNSIDLELEEVAFLKSKNGKFKSEYVKRFAPKAQNQISSEGLVNNKKELKILCSTDVLSEGQNLQDCGIIINYDLHWNPVKMVQRNGRINRLGSTFETVNVFNFRPEDQLDKFLRLMLKLQEKIQVIGASVGLDSSVLGENITPKQFGLIENIYSDDPEKQKQAIESLERENDLAFDEVFENDLRTFMRKASDDEKERIRNLNLEKWCDLEKLTEKERLLLFNIAKGEFRFMMYDGKISEQKNHLKALTTIRSFDQNRQEVKIDNNEKNSLRELSERYFNAEKSFQMTMDFEDLSDFQGVRRTGGITSLASYKEELLSLLTENMDRYSNDNINRMRVILTKQNYLPLDNRLRSFVNRNNGKVTIDFLDNLAIISNHLLNNDKPEEIPEPKFWYGYY
ncbi:MAG: DEAD/DEAH box helicase family protein [Flavobacteriales bacterium]|nr:DEAD/DEAH box helicase family protein [Flavobacteriales bacterium]